MLLTSLIGADAASHRFENHRQLRRSGMYIAQNKNATEPLGAECPAVWPTSGLITEIENVFWIVFNIELLQKIEVLVFE